MSDSPSKQTSWSNRTASFIGALGFIFLFLLILWVTYLPYRPEPIAEEMGKERLKNLREVRNHAEETNSSYGVVDQTKGIYRIPVEEAMRLTVEEYGGEESGSSPGRENGV